MSPTKRLTFQTISQDLQGQEPGSQRLSMGACITSPSTNHLHPRHYCSLHSPMDLLLGYASSENENESKESNKRKLSPVGSSKAEAPPQKKRYAIIYSSKNPNSSCITGSYLPFRLISSLPLQSQIPQSIKDVSELIRTSKANLLHMFIFPSLSSAEAHYLDC